MAKNLFSNKKIAIVGGGPGGLTLARLLQMKGTEVKVYERDLNKDVRVQGATLDLHEDSGLEALNQAGLMEAFQANYRPGADLMRIIDNRAKIVYDQHAENSTEPIDKKYFRPEIDRGPLRKILLESLQPDTVVWNNNFASLTPQNGSWKIEFKNGTSALADMVIGADGANSKIRPYITPIKPFYAGVTAVEGTVYNSETASPKMHTLLKGGKIFGMGNDKTLFVSSKGDGSLNFYTCCKTDENWSRECGIDFSSKAEVFAWFKNEYSGWSDIWQELFENADSHFITRPIYSMPLDQTWEALPNLTILGDAAHLMPPFAGEGVNMAMLDALELSTCLTNNEFKDIHSAIVSYEKEMRERASAATKMSLDSQGELHSPNAIPFIVGIVT